MNRFLFFLTIAVVGYFGFRMGEGTFVLDLKQKVFSKMDIHPELEFPCTKRCSFTFVVYASNQALWCERSLKSIFMQDYEPYRVIVVDDASTDETYETINNYILNAAQSDRVLLIRNDTRLGFSASLYRAIENCPDREIVIPLEAKDWLVEEGILTRLNEAFQNPDVWMARSHSLLYPEYKMEETQGLTAFYAALFKQVPLEDFFSKKNYLFSMDKLSSGRVKYFSDPFVFSNEAGFGSERKCLPQQSLTSFQPLTQFPHTEIHSDLTDLLIFSQDSPLALYSLLESVVRYVSGFSQISVMYWGCDERYEKGYQELQFTFPKVQWLSSNKKDFKPFLLKTLAASPAKYILFAVDDLVVKDFVDLTTCMHLMQRTNAYGFYLQLGENITHCSTKDQDQAVPPAFSIGQNAFAWDHRRGKNDWNIPNTLDMALYRKTDIQSALKRLSYTHFDQLESIWSQEFPKQSIGLFFEKSKIVSLPLKQAHFANESSNCMTAQEMLAKWDEGLKMDIHPLFQIDNVSLSIDYVPDFIQR
jgi:hypothetical protein